MARTKLILLVLLLQILVKYASAQWQIMPVDTPSSNGYYSSITYASDSTGFLDGCSEPSAWNTIVLLRTTNKGRSWENINQTTGGDTGCSEHKTISTTKLIIVDERH
jgi:hypothetical protein